MNSKWTLTTAYDNGEPVCFTIRCCQQPICDVHWVPPITEEQALENARLIAHAPELADALRAICDDAAFLTGRMGDVSRLRIVSRDLIEKGREILKRLE